MIESSFSRNEDGRIVSFEVSGHADSGPYGNDIVCAAVSALSISTINGIDALTGVSPIVNMDEEDGSLYVEICLNATQEQLNITQILLENLLLGLQSIQKENHEYIQIRTITQK